MVKVVPGPGSRIDQHQSPVRLDGALNDGQSESAPAGSAGYERLKQPLPHLFRDARAVVRTCSRTACSRSVPWGISVAWAAATATVIWIGARGPPAPH